MRKTYLAIFCLAVGLTAGLVIKKDLYGKKPVYMVIDINVQDRQIYTEYRTKARDIVEQYGGRYLVRSNEVNPIAGDWHPDRMIIIEFDSKEQLQKCFSSPQYREIAPLRERSTIARAIVVEGYKEQ